MDCTMLRTTRHTSRSGGVSSFSISVSIHACLLFQKVLVPREPQYMGSMLSVRITACGKYYMVRLLSAIVNEQAFTPSLFPSSGGAGSRGSFPTSAALGASNELN